MDNAGLEDVHNLGINWQQQMGDNTSLNLAYFVRDGGSFVGNGDAARYAANYVKPEDGTTDDIEEKICGLRVSVSRFRYRTVRLNLM